jgi:hypothetical protein
MIIKDVTTARNTLRQIFTRCIGGSNRQRSMKYGLCVPLCRECHSLDVVVRDLRVICQRLYEKNHTRDEFISIIGKSYL